MCYPSNVSFVSQDHFFIVVLYNLLLWNENVFTKKCGSLGSNYCFDTYLIPLPGNIFMFDSSNLIFWIIILSTVAEINRMNKLCCNHLKLIPRWYKISYWDSMMKKAIIFVTIVIWILHSNKLTQPLCSHSVLQLWLVEKKFARYTTIPIILFNVFPIEIWFQTNILTMAFWENPIFVISFSKSLAKMKKKLTWFTKATHWKNQFRTKSL